MVKFTLKQLHYFIAAAQYGNVNNTICLDVLAHRQAGTHQVAITKHIINAANG